MSDGMETHMRIFCTLLRIFKSNELCDIRGLGNSSVAVAYLLMPSWAHVNRCFFQSFAVELNKFAPQTDIESMGPVWSVCSTAHFFIFERSNLKKAKGLECFSVSLLSRFDLRLEAFVLLPDVLTPVRPRPFWTLEGGRTPASLQAYRCAALSYIHDMSFVSASMCQIWPQLISALWLRKWSSKTTPLLCISSPWAALASCRSSSTTV